MRISAPQPAFYMKKFHKSQRDLNPSRRVNPGLEKGYPARRVDPGWLLRSCKYLLQVDRRRVDPLKRVEANLGSCKGGLSDHHKMVVTVLKYHFVRTQPKTIHCRDYHQFSPDAFITDLIQRNVNSLPVSTLDPNKVYAQFCDTFKTILYKHAPLKSKVLRGNHAPFITKELSKGIMT